MQQATVQLLKAFGAKVLRAAPTMLDVLQQHSVWNQRSCLSPMTATLCGPFSSLMECESMLQASHHFNLLQREDGHHALLADAEHLTQEHSVVPTGVTPDMAAVSHLMAKILLKVSDQGCLGA